MDTDLRAELLTLRALLLLTLGEVANTRSDPDRFLSDAKKELLRALGGVRIEPAAVQDAVQASALSFARDWFTHIHFKDDDSPPPH